jgi:FkbM family methyltransferase
LIDRVRIILLSVCYKIIQSFRKLEISKTSDLSVFANDDLGLRIVCFGEFEGETLTYLRDQFKDKMQDSHFIDIGANIGNHTIGLQNCFLHCHAFEPNPRTFRLLKANTAEKANVTCYSVALSDVAGEADFDLDFVNSGKSHIVASELANTVALNASLIKVKTEKLDIILDPYPRIGFIKIDVEGHEMEVLRGATNILREQKPPLLLEVLASEIHGGRAACLDFLRDIGYDIFQNIEPSTMAISCISDVPYLRWLNHFLLLLDLTVIGPRKAKIQLLNINSLKKKNYNSILIKPSL